MEKWFTVALLSHKDMDLRDPFFLVKDETLYLFSGYLSSTYKCNFLGADNKQ